MTGTGLDVLVVFGGYPGQIAGAERMGWRTIAALRANGHRVVTLTDSAPLPGVVAGPTFASAADLAAALPDWRPDVVHAFDLARHEHVELGARLANRYGAPFALTPSSAAGVWSDPAAARAACRRADVLFTLTAAERAELTTHDVRAERIIPIPHALDLTEHARPAEFRQRHGLTGPVVLFAARRLAFKGYRELLAATTDVWRQLPDTEFVFLGPDGDPDCAEVFRAHADPRVHDLGMVDEQTKHDAFAACAVFCLPTSVDVFPLAFAEAWWCGRPVVSGDFAGATDVVRHGVDGLVVPVRPDRIAAVLVELLTNEPTRAAMGRAGRERAVAEFGWDRVATAVAAGYRSVVPVRAGRTR